MSDGAQGSQAVPVLSRRKLLDPGLGDDAQSAVAIAHLQKYEAQATERMDIKHPTNSLRPSPNNPRRLSLDRAGVTAERVASIAVQNRESSEQWVERQRAFLGSFGDHQVSERETWGELFELALSIRALGLVQPIVALPCGEIIAGERRWTASCLASQPFVRVIFREVSDSEIGLMRLIENLQRADLSLAEKALAIRQIMRGKVVGPLAPDNNMLSMQLIAQTIGCGTTQSAYYRAICRLPEGDPILEQIVTGVFTNIKQAYDAASNRLLDIAAGSHSGNTQSVVKSLDAGASKAPPPAKKTKLAGPSVKMSVPGTNGGSVILNSLAEIPNISSDAVTKLKKAAELWRAAPDKARKNILSEALATLSIELEKCEEGDA